MGEHTGRMCTRSLRCPQHTDVQRKSVREFMHQRHVIADPPAAKDHPEPLLASVPVPAPPDVVDKEKDIDVDTWEEGDSLASLLTAQVQSHDVPTPNAEASPAESTSTSASSTSSRRRDTKSRNKKKSKPDN